MKRTLLLLVLVLSLGLFAGGVSAVIVNVSPDVIQPNDQITITITDLPNGSTFSLGIESNISLADTTDFKFRANQLVMLFSLQSAGIIVDVHPVETDSEVWVKAKTGSTFKSIGTVAEDSMAHIAEGLGDVSTGTIDYLEVTGTSPVNTDEVIIAMTLDGKKSGVDTSTIPFTLTGITNGSALIRIKVDAVDVVTKRVWIGIGPVKGDLNGNQRVDIGDVALVAYMVVNRAPHQVPAADFNGNGFVDIGDASKIAYFVAGKLTAL